MAIVTKTFSTTCWGDLQTAINNDGAIGVNCLQIIRRGGATVEFEFETALSGAQDTALDALLAGWVCPVLPVEVEAYSTTNPEEGDIITYSTAIGAWSNLPPQLSVLNDFAPANVNDGDVLAYEASSGNWVNVTGGGGGGGGSVFGSEHHEVSSDTESSTTSTTNQTKATMTTSSLPNGKYRIGWFCEMKSSSNKSSAEMEVKLGSTVIGTGRFEPKDANNWEAYSGHYYDTISGVQTIDLNYSREGGSATASIRRARIEIWRIS